MRRPDDLVERHALGDALADGGAGAASPGLGGSCSWPWGSRSRSSSPAAGTSTRRRTRTRTCSWRSDSTSSWASRASSTSATRPSSRSAPTRTAPPRRDSSRSRGPTCGRRSSGSARSSGCRSPGGTDLVQLQVSFWVMLVVGALVCALFGVLFGAPTLRLARRLPGDRHAGLRRDRAGGGAQLGLVHQRGAGPGRGPDAEAVRLRLRVLAVPVLLPRARPGGGAVFVSFRLQESRVGRAWMAIREDELAAGAMGVDHVRYKLLAFAIGASDRRPGGDVPRRQARPPPPRRCSSSPCP